MKQLDAKINSQKHRSFSCWIKKILLATEAKIALKTCLAAAISLFIGTSYAKIFERPDLFVSGLWCVMASIVVTQTHLGGTYKAAWIRFLGVLIGSVAGSVLIEVVGAGPVSLAISVFFTVVLCALLNIKDSFRIAALSTAIIIIMGEVRPTIDPWHFAFYRFIDSCVGILVAVSIARLVWPEKAIENIRDNVSKTLSLLSKYFLLSVELESGSPRHQEISSSHAEEIMSLLEENKEYSGEAKIELYDHLALREHWMLVTDQLETVFEAVNSLNAVPKETISKILDDSLDKQLSDITDKIEVAFQWMEKMISSKTPLADSSGLQDAIAQLNNELLRFRGTRTTRKFNLEDVESFFVFFYNLRAIAQALIKMEDNVRKLSLL